MTLRELMVMAEGRQRSDWAKLSQFMALFANANRDPKKTRAIPAKRFNPYEQTEPKKIPKVGIGVLKTVFIDGQIPEGIGQ